MTFCRKVTSNASKKTAACPQETFQTICLSAFAAAAAIALILLLRMPGGTPAPVNQKAAIQQQCSQQKEFGELQVYYKMQINDIMAQMESLYKKEKTPGAAGLLQESKRILKRQLYV